MTDKIVYFLRHGETVTNAAHVFAGQNDVPLNENGIAQAKAVAPLLAHIPFEKVYASDLQRAKHTAALALPNKVCEYTAVIREIDVGSLVGKAVKDCIDAYGEPFLQCRKRFDYALFGGESREQLDARVADFMKLLEQSAHGVIGVVCHGGVIRSVARYILGDFNGLGAAENCSICKVLYKDGKWSLSKWNVTALL